MQINIHLLSFLVYACVGYDVEGSNLRQTVGFKKIGSSCMRFKECKSGFCKKSKGSKEGECVASNRRHRNVQPLFCSSDKDCEVGICKKSMLSGKGTCSMPRVDRSLCNVSKECKSGFCKKPARKGKLLVTMGKCEPKVDEKPEKKDASKRTVDEISERKDASESKVHENIVEKDINGLLATLKDYVPAKYKDYIPHN